MSQRVTARTGYRDVCLNPKRTSKRAKGNPVAPKNPLGMIVDTALDALKDPKGAAEKGVDLARGTATLGRLVAEQTAKSAATKAFGTAGAAASKVGLTRGHHTPDVASEAGASANLRAVPDVNEAGHPPVQEAAEAVVSTTARKAPAKKADGSAAEKAPAKKAVSPEKGPAATKAPAAKNAPANRPATKKAPGKASPAAKKIQPPAPTPAVTEVPERRAAEPATAAEEAKLSPNPELTAKKAAGKASAKKTAAKKAPAKKAPAKKTPAAAAAAKKAAENAAPAPGSEAETVWSTSTSGNQSKQNELDIEVPVTPEDREAAKAVTPADVAKVVESD